VLTLSVHVATAASTLGRLALTRLRALFPAQPAARAWARRLRRAGEQGQASAEYALVLLGAAAVALLVVAWATRTDKVGKLLDLVFDRVLGQIT